MGEEFIPNTVLLLLAKTMQYQNAGLCLQNASEMACEDLIESGVKFQHKSKYEEAREKYSLESMLDSKVSDCWSDYWREY